MSRLKAVKPQAVESTKPKILIYGKPGVGKTFTSLDFPNVYYIDSEGGATRSHYMKKLQASNGVYFGQDQGSLNFVDVIEQIKALATEKHDYRTLVIDSLSKIFNNEIAKEQERMDACKITDSFGSSKKPAIRYCRQLINWVDKLDMNVILVCQEKAVWENDKQAGVTFDCWEKLGYELDLCFNIIKVGDSRRALVTKSRLESFKEGERLNWSIKDFAVKYGEDVIYSDVKTIELATAEQITQARNLIDLLKVPSETIGKWLEKSKCETLEEMSSIDIQKIIQFLKAKINITEDVQQ